MLDNKVEVNLKIVSHLSNSINWETTYCQWRSRKYNIIQPSSILEKLPNEYENPKFPVESRQTLSDKPKICKILAKLRSVPMTKLEFYQFYSLSTGNHNTK